MEDALKKEGQAIQAMSKIKKDKIEVSMNPKKYLLEHTQLELKKLEAVNTDGFTEKDIAILEQAKINYKKSIDEYANTLIDGYMVPLKYIEIQSVKNGVLEALDFGAQFNWDEGVRVKAMIREEHTLTVYFTLRKKEDITKRYYDSLEQIANEPDSAIEQLYLTYVSNFVLTEQERKN